MLNGVWMPRRSLLTMLLNTMVSIMIIVRGGIPKGIKGIVGAINEQRKAAHIVQIIEPGRVECPNVQPHLVRVTKPQNMCSDP